MELRRLLWKYPKRLPVTAVMDECLPVLDATGDSIVAQVTGYFEVQGVQRDREFVIGSGFSPVVALRIGTETTS